MADIVAGDVTYSEIYKTILPVAGSTKGKIQIACRLTIDPGTTDFYPTGGIPLTDLFTAGNVKDTGIDVTKPIFGIAGLARISDAQAPAAPAMFNNGGVTAASQTLVLYVTAADDGTKKDTLLQYPAEDITTNTTVTAPLATGDKDIRVNLLLIGDER